MADVAVVQTDRPDSADAGRALGRETAAALGGARPDALVLFASAHYDHPTLLEALDAECRPAILIGCSSAGEFTHRGEGEGLACAMAIRSSSLQFSAGVGRGLRADRAAAARALVSTFRGLHAHHGLYHAALVLTDALAGHADDLVEELTVLTAGAYRLVGGGAGSDASLGRSAVFYGTDALTDAVVALEIVSDAPVCVGAGHGWRPASPPLRVTEVDGLRLVSLNAVPAAEVFEEHAAATGQRFDPDDPLPFFLHNVLGIDTGQGYRLRVPLSVGPDGVVLCAAEVPRGARVHIMETAAPSTVAAAAAAGSAALGGLAGRPPAAAVFFDCMATRLRMGRAFGAELAAVRGTLGTVPLVGCNTLGQIARADGQFSGFHNCTAVVCVLPT
ncbi:MAG TPA: FIST N-terminal domain-containing protein [Thermodesulfobacteriota bacterium]|nr:FIST N-terminal domain-containing protein [Thermodesulfobacteriota bacterium]